MNQTAQSIIAKLQSALVVEDDVEQERSVGTPERPTYIPRSGFPQHGEPHPDELYLYHAKEPVRTGESLRRQDGDFAHNALRNGTEKDPDAFFPLARRARRRHAQQQAKANQRRGQRLYVRRELVKERAASDLANLFHILDAGPDHPFYQRAGAAIEARHDYLLTEALKADPDSELATAEIISQLRAVASTADTRPRGSARTKANRAAKAAQREKALADFAESQRVGHTVPAL